MSNSLSLNQIVNDKGSFTIDVFKNYSLPDDSKLILNCHGDDFDSITMNSPNGGIYSKCINYNIGSKNINLIAKEKIKISSLKNISIDAFNYIDIGRESSNILVNNAKHFLKIDFTEYRESFCEINTNSFILTSGNNNLSVKKDSSFNFRTNKSVNIGNNFNNVLTIDVENDIVYINGNLSINGNILISDDLIKYKNIETIVTNNSILFDLQSNPNQDWSISSSNNGKYCGIFFNNSSNTINLQNGDIFLNLQVNSLKIDNTNSNKEYFIDVGEEFYLDNNYNLTLKGNFNLNGKFNISDKIIGNNGVLFVNNDILLNNISFSKFFEFTVGKNLKFTRIQDCIDYIEDNQLSEEVPIFIQIYPDKIYKENIIIKKKNINILGKYMKINIIGSLSIDFKNCGSEYNEVIISNLSIKTSISYSNKYNLYNSSIKLENVDFEIMNKSDIDIIDANKINCINVSIKSDNSSELNIVSKDLYFKDCNLSTNINISSSKLILQECYIFMETHIWKVKVNEVIRILRSELNHDNKDTIKIQDKFLKNRIAILLDCIIKNGDKISQYYPKIILQPNYYI